MVINTKKILPFLIYSIVLITIAFSSGVITTKQLLITKQEQSIYYKKIQTTEQSLANQKSESIYKNQKYIYTVSTYRHSYFKLDENGELKLKNSLPYRFEGIYHQKHLINSNESAVIVMDPWVNMPSKHLNKYYGKILHSHILPLVKSAYNRGHPVIVLTNNCNVTKYSCRVDPQLEAMAANKQINIIFHQNYDDEQFAAYLRSQGIKSLIYTGFASNACVIGRKIGMIFMQLQGFKIFFVPEASAAVEFSNTWKNQTIHQETTKIISQWIAQIIEYNDLMQALSIQ